MTTADLEAELSRLRAVETELRSQLHESRIECGKLRSDLHIATMHDIKLVQDMRDINERLSRVLTNVRGA